MDIRLKGKKILGVLIAVFVITEESCFLSKGDSNLDICFADNKFENIQAVSFENVRSYDKQIVKIEGVLHYNFEDVAVYQNNSSEPSNALWVEFSKEVAKDSEKFGRLNNSKVVLIGKVDLSHKGHFSEYIGTLDSVFCIKQK